MADELSKPLPDAPQLIPADLKYEDAFSRNVVLAALFVGVVMLPGAMYMGLVAGVGLGGAAEWVTLILFLETARRTFVTLRPQELMLIYWAAGAMIGVSGAFGSGLHTFGGSFGEFIWAQYLIRHPLVADIAPKIPDWVVPPVSSAAYALRTFFHHDWLKPILIGIVVTILYRINAVTLGYVLFRATADAERLPFPLVKIEVGGTLALSESSTGKETWRWRIFSIGAMIGVAWGLLYVGVPVITSALAPTPITLIPIPWVDFTTAIQQFLPGAIFGISTGLGGYIYGMVLPRSIGWGQVTGSIIGGMIIPPILFHLGQLPEWKAGYAAIPTAIALRWNFWISFGMGVGLVFGWAGLIAMFRQLRKRNAGMDDGLPSPDAGAPSSSPRPDSPDQPAPTARAKRTGWKLPLPPAGRGDFSTAWCLILWAASTLGLVLMVKILVPDFPVWIVAVFGLIWTPLNSYITARMVGITGSQQGAPFPFLREFTFFLSNYRGVALWFAPVPLYDHGWEPRTFKQLEMSRTRFSSWIKLMILTTVLAFVFSGIYWSLIWKLGPIPSPSYPYAQTFWPFGVQNQYLWLSITDPESPSRAYFIEKVLNYRFIGMGAAVALALWGITALLRLPTLFFFAMIGSLQIWPHDSVPVAIGLLVGARLAKKYGKETWDAWAPVLGAGFASGMGLIGMVAIAVTLMAKAVTPLPY